MVKYYRGPVRKHAAFWTGYRLPPRADRWKAFIDFFRQVDQEVKRGECTLRNAGFAIEPGYYDEEIQADPHGGDMTIACDLATELAGWVFESLEEAEDDWEQIVGIMQKYL